MTVKVWWPYNNGKQLYDWIKSLISSHWWWTINTDTPPVSEVDWNWDFTLEFTSSTTLDWENVKLRVALTDNIWSTNDLVDMWIVGTSWTQSVVSSNASSSASLNKAFVSLWDDFIIIPLYFINGAYIYTTCAVAWNLVSNPINLWWTTWEDRLLCGFIWWDCPVNWSWLYTSTVASGIFRWLKKYKWYNLAWTLTNPVAVRWVNNILTTVIWNNNIEQSTNAKILVPALCSLSSDNPAGTISTITSYWVYWYFDRIFTTNDQQNWPFSTVSINWTTYFLIYWTAYAWQNPIYIKFQDEL